MNGFDWSSGFEEITEHTQDRWENISLKKKNCLRGPNRKILFNRTNRKT